MVKSGLIRSASAADSASVEQGFSRNIVTMPTRAELNPKIPIKSYLERLTLVTKSRKSLRSFLHNIFQPLEMLATITAVGWTNEFGTICWYHTGSLTTGLVADPSKNVMGVYTNQSFDFTAWFPSFPGGALMFGIGLHNGASWPIIAVGHALSQFGLAPINSIAVTYITDACTKIVGDALVGIIVIRNVVGTSLVFALSPWMRAVGVQNMIITIAAIHFAALLGVGVFIKVGKSFRARSVARYEHYASRQYQERD
ncbi:Fc.00g108360.m01.CDS01 [Cosmosporella sp. VM-42]